MGFTYCLMENAKLPFGKSWALPLLNYLMIAN